MKMIHTFQQSIAAIEQPSRFTCPFHYTPHPLCMQAAQEVQHYLASRADWQEELQRGKMFGVLVVETPQHELGYLAAFSGILAGNNQHPFFVPPIYDLLQPDGFFRLEEERISAINREVNRLTNNPEYQRLLQLLQTQKAKAEAEVKAAKEAYKAAKKEREARRKELESLSVTTIAPCTVTHSSPTKTEHDERIHEEGIHEEQAHEKQTHEEMIRESQFQKAELKRLERRWKATLDALQMEVDAYQTRIRECKQERKSRSAALQLRLFEQFRLKNAKGETIDLCTLFQQTLGKEPPAGAGECAAPKLLQYAYLNHLRPVCMAEFWWGDSPKQEIRHHGFYYPACQSKCGPILGFMLQGLPVETNPLTENVHRDTPLEILYEDEALCVVNKPAGMLSVPGKASKTTQEELDSVYQRMRQRYPEATGPLIVHRLDMDTSGLLVIAKSLEVYHHLQEQFTQRSVNKRYIALLNGRPAAHEGEIHLALRPDLEDRPRQLVDCEQGKEALTRYEVLEERGTQTLVALYPLTGRTHQLRVHAAHPEGLHCPIHGDSLYGQQMNTGKTTETGQPTDNKPTAENKQPQGQMPLTACPTDRLCLHAESLQFVHPTTGQKMTFQCKADFE